MSAKRRAGLGKGLSSLLPDKPETEIVEEKESSSFEIALDIIDTNPFQPRQQFVEEALQELSDSIRMQGVIQPIAVRKAGERYQLISGERRLKASKLVGLKTIPAYIREANDGQMLELGIIENVQRENLNPIEIAHGYQRLINECNLSHSELGERVGKNRSTVNNYLRLLALPDVVQDGLVNNQLSMGHARALLGLDEKDSVEKVFHQILEQQLSVRKVERLVKMLNSGEGGELTKEKSKKTATSTSAKKKMILTDYQDNFEKIFNKKVLVEADENEKGEIKVTYNSREELDDIIKKLTN